MAEAYEVTATQAAEQLTQNIWLRIALWIVVVALAPAALYGKNYLDQRFEAVDRRFASVDEKLTAASVKERTNDGVAEEFRTRISLLEQTMARGREERERFQKETQEVLHEIRITQLETAKAIAAILATTAETNRLQRPPKQ